LRNPSIWKKLEGTNQQKHSSVVGMLKKKNSGESWGCNPKLFKASEYWNLQYMHT
jgi:hypothetical protein